MKVIVRAIGPSLVNHGITNPLRDPTLELHNGDGTLIGFNDNWKDSQRAEIQRWLEAHDHALDTTQWFEDTETGATRTRSGFPRQDSRRQPKLSCSTLWSLKFSLCK